MGEPTEAAPAAAETTEANEVTATETGETSAETETTETPAPVRAQPDPVPYSRFKEVNEGRKRAHEALERAQARIRELEAKETKPAAKPEAAGLPDEIPDPPEHFTPVQKMSWYIRQGARSEIEKELGMSLADAKTLLSINREVGTDYAERQWISLCENVGKDLGVKLDPKDSTLRQEASRRIKDGYEATEAIEMAARRAKKVQAKPNGKTASVEDSGVTNTMTEERWLPASVKEANEAARAGKRAPMLSATEILAAKTQAKR